MGKGSRRQRISSSGSKQTISSHQGFSCAYHQQITVQFLQQQKFCKHGLGEKKLTFYITDLCEDVKQKILDAFPFQQQGGAFEM
jgi:hypothetical protein